ncbi:MAG: putative spermidine/putrescine transport system substrate-binding protein [Chloroflexota bacterium]|jgi:putative spermidine/putrescine transport system substrate-binding protein|nr:putative spermidine/putrescine transport system substrate-binding protein [Chloroflexota bacterium]
MLLVRRPIGRVVLVLAITLIGVACAGAPTTIGPSAPNKTAAAEQARTFVTYGMADSLGNYGEQFTTFCLQEFGFDCNRPGRSQAEDLFSAEEIQKFDAEKNNPGGLMADANIAFIPQAVQVNTLADYEAPNAALLPDHLHGPGWVAVFVGVPTIMVNVGFLESHGLPIPHSWADLLNPAYAGMIGLPRVGTGGSGTFAFVAMNLAAGGSLDNWEPGVAYAKQLLPNLTSAASVDTFERGEVPISVRSDFNNASLLKTLLEHGVNAEIFVPTDGSVYATQTLIVNRYDVAHQDFAKMFMEWVLTDEAQVIFAEFGARPIRSVVGDNPLVVPDDARALWLPDADYSNVQTVDATTLDPNEILDIWENQVLSGS